MAGHFRLSGKAVYSPVISVLSVAVGNIVGDLGATCFEAWRLPLFDHAPKGAGVRAYEALTLEVMSRGDGHQEERLDPAGGDLPEHDAA
jgi:hypothetical protein